MRRFAAALLTAVASCSPTVDRVLARYPQNEFPTRHVYKDDLAFPPLDRPATFSDVAAGRALFTLEGLGERRVWQLPKAPHFSVWWANRSDARDDTGLVVQAEELLVGGEWRRYLGFLSEKGASVVPAREIDLQIGRTASEEITWTSYPGGLDLGMDCPNQIVVDRWAQPGPCALDRPIILHTMFRNRRGGPIQVPSDLYRSGERTSFRKGLGFRLLWAPFDPLNPSEQYPPREDLVPVPALFRTHDPDPAAPPGAILATGEQIAGWRLDLRGLFDISREGRYQIQWEVDAEELGLGLGGQGGQTVIGFAVGDRPRRKSLEELNAEIGRSAVDRLPPLIHEGMNTPRPDADGAPPLPADFPAFSDRATSGDGSSTESQVSLLAHENRDLIVRLKAYSAGSVRKEFEKRMVLEKTVPALALLHAVVAALHGSEQAALRIAAAMRSTHYETIHDAYTAIAQLLWRWPQDPPDWLARMAMAAVADDRHATRLEEANFSKGTSMTLSYVADEDADLPRALADRHCLTAVPLLIERFRKSEGARGYTMALHAMGDPRAVPAMLELLREFTTHKTYRGDRHTSLLSALGGLKSREAVPLLIANLEYEEAIQALERIGDPAALPPLRALVGSCGLMEVDGKQVTWGNGDRWFKARLAVIALEGGDPLPRLWELLDDPSLTQFFRRDVVARLYDRPDPRSVPVLKRTILHDPSGSVVNPAIEILGAHRFPESVDALIECFDASFEGKSDWRRASTPEMFRQSIASALQTLTGENLPAQKSAWETWWDKNRGPLKK